MNTNTKYLPPRRITDLVELKKSGFQVTCDPSFEILPVDFAHKKSRFQAYIFLSRFHGTVNDNPYQFRKCYARGCPHNLCTHVAQAVMIANRYLQRDMHRLRQVGIDVPDRLFSLDEMVVKFDAQKENIGPSMTIHDFINMAREGNQVKVEIHLEFVPAVEHFAREKNKQTFLNSDFTITTLGKTSRFQRCVGCYPTEKPEEKPLAIEVANQRLALLYQEFDQVGIQHEKRFFE